MKVLVWNVNRAGVSRAALWALLQREAPDIALLQEVSGLPPWVQDRYHWHLVRPRYFSGNRPSFATAVLSRWPIDTTPFLSSSLAWVNAIHLERFGWILECSVTRGDDERFRLVSVQSPAFAIPGDCLDNVDISPIRLTNNPELWFTEILWSLLRHTKPDGETGWIVGGDFNSSVLFDSPVDRGNRQVVDRMNRIGLTDCLSHFNGGPVPTFRHSRGSVLHQLDCCYVDRGMLERLTHAAVLNRAGVFDDAQPLSDHLPIVCEFA